MQKVNDFFKQESFLQPEFYETWFDWETQKL